MAWEWNEWDRICREHDLCYKPYKAYKIWETGNYDVIRFECFSKTEANKIKEIMKVIYPKVVAVYRYPWHYKIESFMNWNENTDAIQLLQNLYENDKEFCTNITYCMPLGCIENNKFDYFVYVKLFNKEKAEFYFNKEGKFLGYKILKFEKDPTGFGYII